MSPRDLARWVALPVAVVAISTSGILIRLTEAYPLVTATNRLLLTSALLLPFALLRPDQGLRRVRRRTLWLLALSGLLLGLHFALWTSALFWTSVASAVLLTDTHPVLVALGAGWFLSEATPAGVWAGIVLTLLGGLVIGVGDLTLGGRALIGDAMAVGASATFAGYLLIGRRVRQELGIAAYAGVVYGIAALTAAALALAAGQSLRAFSERDLLLWIGLVIFPTLGGHTVINWTLRHLPVSVVGVSILGEPIATTTLAWLLLAEPPSPMVFVGGAITLSGIYLALRSDRSNAGA
jgi:drug/metabolite transporter (DMT)-like permease